MPYGKTEAEMKKGYKIGLFFALLLIVLFIVLLVWRRYIWREQFPDKLMEQNTEQQTQDGNAISSSQKSNIRTTCNTVCIYEDIDKKDGTVVITEEKIPGKYIDMTRSELERALYDDSMQLSLEDKKRGFQTQHLELFSEDRIKIVRIYDTTEERNGYYIMAVNHEIWIFKEDKETLYFKTDLLLEDLPEKVQSEVIKGKYMDSEVKIYHFLESYSS